MAVLRAGRGIASVMNSPITPQVVASFLADHADMTPGELLNVRTGYRRIVTATSFPTEGEATAVFVLEDDRPQGAARQVGFRLRMTDGQGNTVKELGEGEITLLAWEPQAPLGMPVLAIVPCPMTVYMPGPGFHNLLLELDGQDAATYKVYGQLAS